MRSALVLPLLALLAACAHPGGGPVGSAGASPAGVAAYFPLAVGNEWVWEDVSPALPEARRGALRTVRIEARTADGFFRDGERGELKVIGPCVQDRVRQILCAPFTAGASWKSVVSVSSTEKYEIAAVGETVVTPAGTFQGCVRVRALNRAAPGADLVNEISYAPGVGPVRIETFAVIQGQAAPQFRALLRRYRVEAR
ncbi:MAG TPA: hypothetical protein VFP50_17245 [Anaeromyxobacteraceae bacterium]|nr:hypothetical protein [Anaeromyxobacteraceae bacterium]